MNGISEMVMLQVHGTGRLKYTCYRVFPFLNKTPFYFLKKIISILYTGRAKRWVFCSFHQM